MASATTLPLPLPTLSSMCWTLPGRQSWRHTSNIWTATTRPTMSTSGTVKVGSFFTLFRLILSQTDVRIYGYNTWRLEVHYLPYSSGGPLYSALLLVFDIALLRLVIYRPTPDVAKHSQVHSENSFLVNCHLHKSNLYPINDFECQSQAIISFGLL